MSEERPDDVISEFPFSGGDDGDPEEFVCSDCGSTFETERGLNIHAGQVHDDA